MTDVYENVRLPIRITDQWRPDFMQIEFDENDTIVIKTGIKKRAITLYDSIEKKSITWESLADCARETGAAKSSIDYLVSGKIVTLMGKRYFKDEKEYLKDRSKEVTITLLDNISNKEKVFRSIKEAATSIGVSYTAVYQALRKKGSKIAHRWIVV
jgi:hypothetical protein